MFDTIASIVTGFTNQPVSIIRISGPSSFLILKNIFSGPKPKKNKIIFGVIKNKNKKIDEVLVSWFKGPNSFTGEDVVEINAHGGVINSNQILELILNNGARLAEKGEFSRRAFLNGKLDLIKAEAIHDLIFAKTQKQAQLAVSKFDEKTSSFVASLIKKILEIIAIIETNIDYPEYDDIENLNKKKLLPKLKKLKIELEKTISVSEDSRYIFEGLKIAIVGKPNSGKSTLLNALLNQEKAIVTKTPGTTRDVVEGEIVLGGILLKIVDTAGIRNTKNTIEKKGVAKSLEQIKKANLVVHLIDPFVPEGESDYKIFNISKSKIYLKVFNKKDLLIKKETKNNKIFISAKNKQIQELTNKISELIPLINIDNHKMVTNARQLSLIKRAYKNLIQSIKNLEKGFLPSEVIVDIKQAWENLTNITGRADNEQLLDQMFKNFCLGK